MPKVEIVEVKKNNSTVIEVIEQGPLGPQGPQGPVGPAPDLSSPPPIGDVTPNTGDFTNLSASVNVTTPWITSGQYQAAEIYLNDTTGDVEIVSNSGSGTIQLSADNTIGEDIQAQKFSLDTAVAAIAGVGEMAWNDTDGTIDLGLKGGNSTLQLGQELVLRVKNDDSVQLTDGMVVYVSGANGTNLLVKRAEANAELTSASTIGVVTEPITVNGHGYITTFGVVRGINTNGFNAGDILYLSPTNIGELTNVKPAAPNHMVMVGFVVKKSAGSGEVFVQVQNGYELDELHNVSISGVASGQVLKRNAGNTLWENTLLAASDITSGTLDNARINWAAPSAIGGTTAAAGTFTSLASTGLSLASGTLTASAPFDFSQTWNNSGVTFTGRKTNITDTNSAAASLIEDWQVGGAPKAQLTKLGSFLAYNTYTNSTNYERGFFKWDSNVLKIGTEKGSGGGTARALELQTDGVTRILAAAGGDVTIGTTTVSGIYPTLKLAWSDRSVIIQPNGSADGLKINGNLDLARASSVLRFKNASDSLYSSFGVENDTSNVLVQKNGTSAQEQRLYGTYTDASNYRRLSIASTTAGRFTLAAQGAGTGASGNELALTAPILAPSSSVTLGTNGDLAFEATSNTTLTVKYRGSDGTTRSTNLTLS